MSDVQRTTHTTFTTEQLAAHDTAIRADERERIAARIEDERKRLFPPDSASAYSPRKAFDSAARLARTSHVEGL